MDSHELFNSNLCMNFISIQPNNPNNVGFFRINKSINQSIDVNQYQYTKGIIMLKYPFVKSI